MLADLKRIMDELDKEMFKVERGNQAAGVRARKLLQDIRFECKNLRDQIQTMKQEERI